MYKWLSTLELTIVLFSTFYGTIMNAGFIGTFYVDRTLKKKGNAYLTALGFADLTITLIVMPICAILKIKNQMLTEDLCDIMQLFTKISTNSYNLLTMFVAAGNYFHTHPEYRLNSVLKIIPASIVIPMIVLICTVIEIVGIYSYLNFDFCDFEQQGNLHFRIAISIFIHFLPAVFSFAALLSAAKKARENRVQVLSPEERLNYTVADLSLITYLLYIICWIPYLMTIYIKPDVNSIIYNYVLWIGLIRSAFGNSLYIIFNKYFRRGFTVIFKYVCCPTSLGFIDHPPEETISEAEYVPIHVIRPRLSEETRRE